ncbi:DoxX family protein [Aquabacter spiritensis]|uniref:Putative oxidoreductase n=1 Tax=Aquabacter spiritensis TaxID=933073 RepID=A0A4R3LZ52_9HYPH|nr:DoxX family protein [Aquabacter spiritensis]TCT05556.1 putative oxidoreductase [Aquabacter spiritensis]
MIDPRTAPYGLFLLRAALGVMWIAHALMKYVLFTIPGFAGFLGSVGLPTFLAWPIFLAELVGGLLILFGVHARQVAVLLIPVMAGAMMVHVGNGWVFSAPGGGWEYPAFLIVASLVVGLSGEGAFALRPAPLLPRPAPAAA